MNTPRAQASVSPAERDHRRVSIPLIIGITLVPYIFAWFVLRPGYSKQVRVIGLGWLGLIALIVIGVSNASSNGEIKTRSKVDIDPHRADKDATAYVARRIVASALKDPTSAEFGKVWGMSDTVACGYVNSKNSFGAMAGQSRFIMYDGKVSFEQGGNGFARHWNAICVAKPVAPPPTGASGMRWGSRPPSSLKQSAPQTDEGLAVYVPKAAQERLENVAVAAEDYEFDHGRLFAANFYIDGPANRDAILATYVKKYGTPQAYNEDLGSYTWKWPSSRVSVSISYEVNHARTTVHFNHD